MSSPGIEVTNDLKKLINFAKLNPAAFKAWLIKWVIYLVILVGLLFTAYLQGRDDAKTACERNAYKEAAAQQQVRADNATDAGKRYGAYTKTQAELDAAVEAAKKELRDYYAANQPEPRVVEKTKLVQVPGKEELVYVPIGVCPNDLFSPDELRLFNEGNKRTDFNPSHP